MHLIDGLMLLNIFILYIMHFLDVNIVITDKLSSDTILEGKFMYFIINYIVLFFKILLGVSRRVLAPFFCTGKCLSGAHNILYSFFLTDQSKNKEKHNN